MFQYVVVTVCIKAGIETSAWTYVSRQPSHYHLEIIFVFHLN